MMSAVCLSQHGCMNLSAYGSCSHRVISFFYSGLWASIYGMHFSVVVASDFQQHRQLVMVRAIDMVKW